MRASAAILCFLALLASGAANAQALVYRVDTASAVIEGGNLIVRVRGAARTGGWEDPKLLVRRDPENQRNLEVQFVATPPGNKSAVVQSVVPVKASVTTRVPRKAVRTISVVSETNTVTTQIIAKKYHRTARQ